MEEGVMVFGIIDISWNGRIGRREEKANKLSN
jgi:hypothetical protein